jgi:hypothetical protein
MNNDAGYTGSVGPWITPELSMQGLVSLEITVQGVRHVAATLPVPKSAVNPTAKSPSKNGRWSMGPPCDPPAGIPITTNLIPEIAPASCISKAKIQDISRHCPSGKLSRDIHEVTNELLYENCAGRLSELAHEKGMRPLIEGYDWDPRDETNYAGQSDEPQEEFWYGRDMPPEIYRSWSWDANTVSVAHIYGHLIAAVEAFSACARENWQAHPAWLKTLGDWAFAAGVNRFIIHRYTMQPWLNRASGMTMAWWGLHHEQTQTWWEESKDWHIYLSRRHFILRQGLFVADLRYLEPEGAAMRFRPPNTDMRSAAPPHTPGYNDDGCTLEMVLARMPVKDGRIVTPNGMSYQLLVLPGPGDEPGAGTVTPQLLKKIKELVEQVATVVGSPPSRSPWPLDLPGLQRCADGRRAVRMQGSAGWQLRPQESESQDDLECCRKRRSSSTSPARRRRQLPGNYGRQHLGEPADWRRETAAGLRAEMCVGGKKRRHAHQQVARMAVGRKAKPRRTLHVRNVEILKREFPAAFVRPFRARDRAFHRQNQNVNYAASRKGIRTAPWTGLEETD